MFSIAWGAPGWGAPPLFRSLTEQKTLVKIMTACKNGMSFTGNLINYTKRRSPVLNELKIDVVNDDCFLVASTKVSDIMYNKMPMCLSNKRGQIECANTSWLDAFGFSNADEVKGKTCLLYTSPSPRDGLLSRMPSSA